MGSIGKPKMTFKNEFINQVQTCEETFGFEYLEKSEVFDPQSMPKEAFEEPEESVDWTTVKYHMNMVIRKDNLLKNNDICIQIGS